MAKLGYVDDYGWRHTFHEWTDVPPPGTYNMPKPTVYFLLIPDQREPLAPKFILWFETRGDVPLLRQLNLSFTSRFTTGTFDQVYQVFHIQIAFRQLDMWARSVGADLVRSTETDYQSRRDDNNMNWNEADGVWHEFRRRAEQAEAGFEFEDLFGEAGQEAHDWRTHTSRAGGGANSYRRDWDPNFADPRGNEAWSPGSQTFDDVKAAAEKVKREQAQADQKRREAAARERKRRADYDRRAREKREEETRREREAANRVFGTPGEAMMYRPLFVTQDAPDVVVRAAFRALALEYHPDKPTANEAKMKELNRAWSDIRKRRGI
jgi:hypothetical protein